MLSSLRISQIYVLDQDQAVDGLSRFTLPIEQAKTPETRARRIETAVVDLCEGRV
jgi:uncharacterized protein YdeI (YjbR/CyaY-like superfamily)